jgi:hypothetical protein
MIDVVDMMLVIGTVEVNVMILVRTLSIETWIIKVVDMTLVIGIT